MARPAFSKGFWMVTRFCCTSGLCIDCHARGNHGDRTKRARIVHTDNVSRKWAEFVASGWPDYDAKAVHMHTKTKTEGLDMGHEL